MHCVVAMCSLHTCLVQVWNGPQKWKRALFHEQSTMQYGATLASLTLLYVSPLRLSLTRTMAAVASGTSWTRWVRRRCAST